MLTLSVTITRLLISFVLGSVIGLEREKSKRALGFRTHILVCVSSTLIMLVSLYMYDLFGSKVTMDPGRIAAGVVTGIGFLGAGTIIRSQERVRGLTTAASIWASAGIGLAVGCGFFSAAIITTIICFFTLAVLKRVEQKIEK